MAIAQWMLAFGMFVSTVLCNSSRLGQMLALRSCSYLTLMSRGCLYLTSRLLAVPYAALVRSSGTLPNPGKYCPSCRNWSVFTRAYSNCDKCVEKVDREREARELQINKQKKVDDIFKRQQERKQERLEEKMRKDQKRRAAMKRRRWEEEKKEIELDTRRRAYLNKPV